MKTNIMKYIFFILVFIMIGLAIFFLYKDGKKKVYAIENEEIEINMVDELNIGISGYDTINPILSKNRDIQYIDKLIFDPLIDIDYNFKTQNKLAKEFSKINELIYIVKLRDDVYFNDGEKLTSDDVLFTLNNLMKDNINSIYKENVKDIKEIQKIDEYTFKIILKNKVDFFEYMMCIPILAKHSYNDNTLHSNTAIPVGTGKFKIEEINDDKIVLTRSNINNKSKIKKINLILKKNANDLYKALNKNEIDFFITDNINFEEQIGSMGYNINEVQNREFDYLVLNNQSSLLKSNKVRKAINYLIDKNEIIYNVYNSKYYIASFPLDYGNYLYNENDTQYDINKAREMLLNEGWTIKNNKLIKNGKFFRLKLLVDNQNEKRVQVANIIKEQLKEIGIIIDTYAVNNTAFNNYIKNKNYDIVLTGNIISNSPNLQTYFGNNNLSNFKNDEIKIILNEVKNIDNQVDFLKEKYQRLEEIYTEEMPFISLYFNSLFIISNKKLKGDLSGNWYNIYYNIDNWYKTE